MRIGSPRSQWLCQGSYIKDQLWTTLLKNIIQSLLSVSYSFCENCTMYFPLRFLAAIDLLGIAALATNQICKTTPADVSWPSLQEWSFLNASIGGALIQTAPVASSCYSNNPFNSTAPAIKFKPGGQPQRFMLLCQNLSTIPCMQTILACHLERLDIQSKEGAQ